MLTSKQRSYLRGLANDIDSIFQIGKAGVTSILSEQIINALEARELIKVTVLNNADLDTKEACRLLSESTSSEPVSCVGHKFVLYKKSLKNQRIFLD